MKQFNSLAAFSLHLTELAALQAVTLNRGLEAVAKRVEGTAKDEIGKYQPAVGPFAAWAELADATKDDRVAQGYPANEPLLRSGELRDSYEHEVVGHEAVVGSKNDVALWQELGTSRGIPPRPVLGPAVIHNHAYILKVLGGAAVAGLMGQKALPAALGYEHDI